MLSSHRRFLGLPVLLVGGVGAFWWRHAEHPSAWPAPGPLALRIGYAIEARTPCSMPTANPPVNHRAWPAVAPSWAGHDLGPDLFDQLIPDLERDRFDLIAAGLFVTPARARRVRFSRPTLAVRPGWLTRADQALDRPYEAVQPRADWRVAVLGLGGGRLPAAPGARAGLLRVPMPSGLGAVLSGEARALALSRPRCARWPGSAAA
jgi:polar amino acid transport system substrate-binding protein